MSNTMTAMTNLYKNALKGYSLTTKQILAILGLGISAYAAFVAIYNSASGIQNDIAAAETSNTNFARKRSTQFIVMIIISCIAIVLGLIISYVLRKSSWIILPLALSLMGVLALVYSIGIKTSDKVQLGLSITLFIIFLIFGIYVGIYDGKERIVW